MSVIWSYYFTIKLFFYFCQVRHYCFINLSMFTIMPRDSSFFYTASSVTSCYPFFFLQSCVLPSLLKGRHLPSLSLIWISFLQNEQVLTYSDIVTLFIKYASITMRVLLRVLLSKAERDFLENLIKGKIDKYSYHYKKVLKRSI